MSAFTAPLDLRCLNTDWRHVQLLDPLPYELGYEGSGRTIIAPAGFITDGASIPRFLWALLSPWGPYLRAAVIHDFLYSRLRACVPHGLAPTRADADAVLREAAMVCGCSRALATIIWAAVRVFGAHCARPKETSAMRATKDA